MAKWNTELSELAKKFVLDNYSRMTNQEMCQILLRVTGEKYDNWDIWEFLKEKGIKRKTSFSKEENV